MGNSTAYADFDALSFWQEFLPNNNGPKYLPEPKTDEERAASIRIIEEERQIGNTVILLDADDYALFYKRWSGSSTPWTSSFEKTLRAMRRLCGVGSLSRMARRTGNELRLCPRQHLRPDARRAAEGRGQRQDIS